MYEQKKQQAGMCAGLLLFLVPVRGRGQKNNLRQGLRFPPVVLWGPVLR
jgi:hypothetical protein